MRLILRNERVWNIIYISQKINSVCQLSFYCQFPELSWRPLLKKPPAFTNLWEIFLPQNRRQSGEKSKPEHCSRGQFLWTKVTVNRRVNALLPIKYWRVPIIFDQESRRCRGVAWCSRSLSLGIDPGWRRLTAVVTNSWYTDLLKWAKQTV